MLSTSFGFVGSLLLVCLLGFLCQLTSFGSFVSVGFVMFVRSVDFHIGLLDLLASVSLLVSLAVGFVGGCRFLLGCCLC